MMKHVQKHRLLYAVLIAAIIARLVFLFDYHEIWWDSGVYFGMAKYLWSGGSAGLWEHIRPVLWPAILGVAWWLKLNMVVLARALEFLLVPVSTVLVYFLGRKWFSQRAAALACIVWAFSGIVFYLGFHEYTELPAATLVLAGLLAFAHKRSFWAGVLVSLAFLMKFPAGIFIVALGLSLLAQRKWKALVPLGAGFAIPAAAFLLFNFFLYGSFLSPFIAARETILQVLGCNVLHYKPWWQYFAWLWEENRLHAFGLLGIGALALRWRKNIPQLLALIVPVAYFMQLHCREYRYLVLFLPMIALTTAHGIALVSERLEKHKSFRKRAWTAIVLLVFALSAFHGTLYYIGNEARTPDIAAERYFHWLENKQIDGEIWSANPVVSAHTDRLIHKIYYPVYAHGTATDFNAYLRGNKNRIGAVLLDNCGGGIICPPDDAQCASELASMRAFLNENFKQVFFEQSGRCWYAVYTH